MYLTVTILLASIFIYLKVKKMTKWMKGVGVVLLFSILSFLLSLNQQIGQKGINNNEITRNETGKGDYVKKYKLKTEQSEKEYSLDINIKEQLATEGELERIFELAKKELSVTILGSNKALDEVVSNLNLPESLVEGKVSAEYTFDQSEIVGWDGTINQQNIEKENNPVRVIVDLNCQNHLMVYEFFINVKKKKLNADELMINEVNKYIQTENEKSGNEVLLLPKVAAGHSLIWTEKKENISLQVFVLGIAGGLCILAAEAGQKKKEWEYKQKMIMADYPGIISKFSLLLGAGMSVSMAWERIAAAYIVQKKKWKKPIRLGYEEMIITMNEIKDGMGEIRAYERFGHRTGHTDYRKFSALLIQNVKKSTSGMQKLLEEEARSAFERRKNLAKKYGEEASSKLLLPMLLMLLVVLIILMFPAVTTIKI